jgi:hypothetical protein
MRETESMMDASSIDSRNSGWKALYKLGGVAAVLAVFVFRRNLGAELTALRGFWPSVVPETLPVNVAGWYELLQRNPLVGLTLLEAFDLVEYALVGLIFLAVCVALWQVSRSAMLVATASGLAGIIVYFSSNQAFTLLALSEHYAAAASEAQRVLYLAAGEASLAIYNPVAFLQGTGIYLSMFLVPLAGLIYSLVMLRSNVFNKATAVIGILANGIILTYFLFLAFAPTWLVIPFVLSAPFRVAWYFLIAIKLFKLGGKPTLEKHPM